MKATEIIVNVIRNQTLAGPWEWADGDYSKVLPDGSIAPATYAEYRKSLGLPVGPNKKIVDK